MINKTTKRLLSASRLGVTFSYGDGHRWINFGEAPIDNTSLAETLDKNKIYPSTKVYGNIIDCLNYVDYLLKKLGDDSLEEQFDKFNDWEFEESWEDGNFESGEAYFENRTTFEK